MIDVVEAKNKIKQKFVQHRQRKDKAEYLCSSLLLCNCIHKYNRLLFRYKYTQLAGKLAGASTSKFKPEDSLLKRRSTRKKGTVVKLIKTMNVEAADVSKNADALWEMVQYFTIYEQVSDGNDDEKKKFDEQWTMHLSKFRGIIAFKGLPLIGKTEFALKLGKRVKCPVLCIEDFFPSPPDDGTDKIEDADCRRLMLKSAFTRLCNVAMRHLENLSPSSTVVIKSRLSDAFEIQELIKLATTINKDNIKNERPQTHSLLIVEFRCKNVLLWKERFNAKKEAIEKVELKWYRPRSWNDIEEAMDHYNEAEVEWDQELKKSILAADDRPRPLVRKLVVDVFDDLVYRPRSQAEELPDDFVDAIKYLLTAPRSVFNNENPYTVKLSELRPCLLKLKWSALAVKKRRESLCPRASCVFQLPDEEAEDVDEEAESKIKNCGVCQEQVHSGTPAYTCRFCILALHKSCAERIQFDPLHKTDLRLYYYENILNEKEVCKLCQDARTGFSRDCGSCLFQSHLKCGPLPTILKHDSHPHSLSLILTKQFCPCKACGKEFKLKDYSYGCKKCALYYQLECAVLPVELKHEHGGYEHVMELKYSHNPDDLEMKEDYWCDFCYKGMDPNYWFYSCKECHYEAHLDCAGAYEAFCGNRKNLKFVNQIQPQWEEHTRAKEVH